MSCHFEGIGPLSKNDLRIYVHQLQRTLDGGLQTVDNLEIVDLVGQRSFVRYSGTNAEGRTGTSLRLRLRRSRARRRLHHCRGLRIGDNATQHAREYEPVERRHGHPVEPSQQSSRPELCGLGDPGT